MIRNIRKAQGCSSRFPLSCCEISGNASLSNPDQNLSHLDHSLGREGFYRAPTARPSPTLTTSRACSLGVLGAPSQPAQPLSCPKPTATSGALLLRGLGHSAGRGAGTTRPANTMELSVNTATDSTCSSRKGRANYNLTLNFFFGKFSIRPEVSTILQ